MAEQWCAYLVLCRDAAEPLADARDSGDPLSCVPAARGLVTADLANTHDRRAEAGLLCRATEELLGDPLALGVSGAVSHLGACNGR